VSTVNKWQASMVVACVRTNSAHIGPDLRGAGSTPCRQRISHTLDGATLMPLLASSRCTRR